MAEIDATQMIVEIDETNNTLQKAFSAQWARARRRRGGPAELTEWRSGRDRAP